MGVEENETELDQVNLCILSIRVATTSASKGSLGRHLHFPCNRQGENSSSGEEL